MSYSSADSRRTIDTAKRIMTCLLPLILLCLAVALTTKSMASDFPLDTGVRPASVEQASTMTEHYQRLSQVAPVHYLVYGSAAEPFQITKAEGSLSGFITDIVNEVFEQSDISINPIMKPIKRIKREMIHGEAKRWVTYALRSWKFEGVWDAATFASVDLLQYHLSLGYKKDDKPVVLQRLFKDRVVWIQGFRYPGANEFSQRYGFQFQRVKNHAAMLKMVEAGRTKFFMEYAPRMHHVMTQLALDSDRYDYYSLESEIPPTSITLLMSNDLGEEVIAFVNHRLLAMKASGRIHQLALHYNLIVNDVTE